MDKLTELIQEAKPLYKQRKRQKTMTTMVLGLSLPMIFTISLFQLYIGGSEVYIALENNTLQTKLLEDEFGLLGCNY